MNIPQDGSPPSKLTQATTALASQHIKTAFDYLLAIGTTDDDLRRRYAAHVLAAQGGNLAAAADKLVLEAPALMALFSDPMPAPTVAFAPTPAETEASVDAAPVAIAGPPVEKKAKPPAKVHSLDGLIEANYQAGIGPKAMLALPEFATMKLQALKNRVTELKLPHRFPEAAALVKSNAAAGRRNVKAETSVTPIPPATRKVQLVSPSLAISAPAISVEGSPATPSVKTKAREWTPALVALLHEHYPTLGPMGIMAMPEFAGYDRKSILNKASRSKLRMTTASDKSIAATITATVEPAAAHAHTEVAIPNMVQGDNATAIALPTLLPAPTAVAKSVKPTPSASITKFGSDYYRAKCAQKRDPLQGIDLDAERARIAERKREQFTATIAALPGCVTQRLQIVAPAAPVASHTPVEALARQLRTQGFNLLARDCETQGPLKKTYISDYYWHEAGLLADICRGANLEPTLNIHAQLICPAGTQPMIKALSPVATGGRYVATCPALGGERKVACVSYTAASAEAGLKAVDGLLGFEVLLLNRLAVPPRGDGCGLVTFKGSTAHHKRVSLSMTPEPLRPCCFEGTKATFANPL